MKDTNGTIWILAAIVFILMLSSCPVQAGRINPAPAVRIDVVSDERGMLTQYAAESTNKQGHRSYVIARDQERYMIRIHNRSNERIGLVIAVDGRNIISGQRSHLKSHERMYILGPRQTGRYDGWRTGRNRVNRFYFTTMNNSYAAAWGDYTATGVIAVAAYTSRHKDKFRPRHKNNRIRPLAPSGAKGFHREPGTGIGETEWSPSKTVRFRPENRAFLRQFFKYEYRSTLCKKGIISCREKKMRRGRNRFWPDHHREFGFAPLPPFWPFR